MKPLTYGTLPPAMQAQYNAQHSPQAATKRTRIARGVVHVAGRMNKTEAAYASRLELQKKNGGVLWYRFEAVTFKLAHDTRYTPDFLVMMADGTLEAHEVKGFFEDDAKVKVKVAAEMFPIRFMLVRAKSQKYGGGFELIEVVP